MKSYGAIVIGAGHNGLTCACYLAKAGLKVLVVEQYHQIGGMTISEEFYPKFYSDSHASCYQLASLSPAIDELNLADYGFELIRPELGLTKVFPDGRYISIMRNIDDTCRTISQFSKRDAQTWRQLFENYLQQKEAMAASLHAPPMIPSQIMAELEKTPEGMDFHRFQLQSLRSWGKETFESEAMRTFMADFAAHANFSPDDGGGALFPWLFTSVIQDYGNQMVKGGMMALPQALNDYLCQHGGEVMTQAKVNKIITNGDRASGIQLANGDTISANHIVSSIHPKHLLLELLADANIDPAIRVCHSKCVNSQS